MYPIPPPDIATLSHVFGPSVAEEMGPPQPPGSAGFAHPGSNPRTPRTPRSPAIISQAPGGMHMQAKPMAIFELLEYIVNQSPPKLPSRIFSENMRDFVERCLKKQPKERPDLQTLSVSILNSIKQVPSYYGHINLVARTMKIFKIKSIYIF